MTRQQTKSTIKRSLFAGVSAILLSFNAWAFELSSPDVAEGKSLNAAQVYKGFGCDGGNLSPALAWKDAPAGVRSFAVTIYDPDAPTGSGWWHWLVYNIPASTSALPAGAAVKTPLPRGARQGRNDFGEHNFGGACPPKNDKPHHYVFSVYALKVDKLDVPKAASAALIGFMLNNNSLGTAKLTATYSR
ncbi:MAG: YbhB/YbcL family Raf kinase inhibitor-like protein [Methylococcales bacterium]